MRKNFILPLAGMMTLAMSATAFAGDIDVAGGSSSVPVPLTAEAATFSVTVPTQLPISVDKDGVVTTATDVKVINNSHGAVKVAGMSIEGQNSWAVVDFDTTNMAAEKVGAKKVAMEINTDTTNNEGGISFTEANFPKMDGANDTDSDELPIVYDAKVPAQAQALTDETVANVIFTVSWDE